MTTPGVMARAGLWSALAFVLNLTWEIAQVRLYTIWTEADRLSVAWALLHCSLGDVVIALSIYVLAGAALRRADWPVSRPWAGVYRASSWGYTASMPLIFGIGLSPLLQWLVLPPVLVVAYRKLGPVLFGQIGSRSPNPTDNSTRG